MDSKQRYDAMNLETVKDYIERGQEENQYLEFKTIGSSTLDKNDKKNLAETISAFANSEGGIIIWGIEPEGELAVKEKPIEPLAKVHGRITDLAGQLISPPVPGIEHRRILIDPSDTNR